MMNSVRFPLSKPLLILVFSLLSAALFAQTVPVTFSVDMSNETISPDGVHIAGDFQQVAGVGGNWDPGATTLSDPDGDLVFEITVQVPTGSYLYKFVNGNDWGDKPEMPDSDCAVNDGGGNFNRQVSVGNSGVNLPVVQFDSCNAVLRLAVNMQGQSVSPDGVHVMGDFQTAAGFPSDWDPAGIPMSDANGDDTYEVSIPVLSGDYQYVFVNGINAAFAESPPAPCASDDGNGNFYRSVSVGSNGVQIPVYCFNTCEICDPALSSDFETYWWNDAVFYEVFVRSFYDSNDDGIGDFQGLTEKLDYLNDGDPDTDTDLGITGIWLMPIMESPSYHGYDATDYRAIEPDYGTMEDFEAFLDAAHERGIRVIIDYVMNHSSSQHPWFSQSANNQNGYRDWYIWEANNPGYNGPWGQPVWHSSGGDYYYGLFWGGMPDLNYAHPPVKAEMFDIAEFWLDKGVDGFRLDAIKYLDEDFPTLENTPENFQLLEEFNVLYKTNNPEAFTVGEVWSNTASILPYVQNDRLDVCFEFDLAYSIINSINSGNASPVYNHLTTIQAGYPKLQYATFLTNHDIDRIFTQLGNNENKMKLAASIYLTLPGIPFVYYGEEIGMTGSGAHENIRRPMQWDNSTNAGFSDQAPWYGVGDNYTTNNVEVMSANDNSLLSRYRDLIHIRNEEAALRRGYLLSLESPDDGILSYARIYEQEVIVVVANTGSLTFPTISLAISSLFPGEYDVTELIKDLDWGTLTINDQGGFESWQHPNGQPINSGETWILKLTPAQTTAVEIVAEPSWEANLFPNPAQTRVNITIGSEKEQVSVQIIDVSGKIRQSASFVGSTVELNIDHLENGVYFVKLTNEEGKTKVLKLFVDN